MNSDRLLIASLLLLGCGLVLAQNEQPMVEPQSEVMTDPQQPPALTETVTTAKPQVEIKAPIIEPEPEVEERDFSQFQTLLGWPSPIERPRWPDREFDPHPAMAEEQESQELMLPMPCGGAMVFRRIEVEDHGLLGGQKVEIGSPSDSDAPLDHRRVEQLAGAFSGIDSRANRHYYLGKYEVTDLQYRVIMDDCPEKLSGRRPVVRVSWYDAVDFTRRYTEWLYQNAKERLPEEDGVRAFLRLPTEVEWEYAARGGQQVDIAEFQQAVFPMGDGSIEDFAWIRETVSSSFEPRPIGSLQPNPLGLYDILGNAAELVFDLFRMTVQGQAHGQSGGYLVKGGHFRSWRDSLSASWRKEHPHFNQAKGTPNRLDSVGFRVAISVPVLTTEDRVKAIREAWEKLPEVPVAVASNGEAGRCYELAQEVRSSLAVIKGSLDQCLLDAGRLTLAPFPESPPYAGKQPARLPTWDDVRDRLPNMMGEGIRQLGIWFLQAKHPDKALLLFKKAARLKDAWSALAIGALYDPLLFESAEFTPGLTPFSKPNPNLAYCWYQLAQALGERGAQVRMDNLHKRQVEPPADRERLGSGCEQIMQQYGGR